MNVDVLDGYWRSSTSAYVLPLRSPDSCKTAYDCEEGYSGFVCATCTSGYGRSADACANVTTTVNWIAIVGMFIMYLIIIWLPFCEHNEHHRAHR